MRPFQAKRRVIKELKVGCRVSSTIYVATDNDREGEKPSGGTCKKSSRAPARIKRHSAAFYSTKLQRRLIQDPSAPDRHRSESRRRRSTGPPPPIADRIVGYQVSPLLWDKVRRGLSAGRVQSWSRCGWWCRREREILAFVSTGDTGR